MSRTGSDSKGSAAMRRRPRFRLFAARLGRVGLACGLFLAAWRIVSAAETRDDLADFLARVQSVWQERDLNAYLSLWEYPDEQTAARERTDAQDHFASDETTLSLQPPRFLTHGDPRLYAQADIFTVKEPRALAEHALFRLRRRSHGWVIDDRATVSQVEGLVHLSLDPAGYRADGLVLTLEDFELRMRRGTLFTAPAAVGMTALVFIGDGQARFTPRPPSEQDQLRQFCGQRKLETKCTRAFVRLNPVDFERIIAPRKLEPDQRAAERERAARGAFEDWGSLAYVLDASLPRSPWWAIPSVGDAMVVFDSNRGDLTYAVSNQPEGLTLFKRDQQLQICLYPKAAKPDHYSEDDGTNMDIIHHDLRLSIDPTSNHFEGEDTLRLRLRAQSPVVRFKLDEALDVESVISKDAGRHIHFRVRNQNSLIVSLGATPGANDEIELTIRYSGRLPPSQAQEDTLYQSGGATEQEIAAQAPKIYANRPYWFPQSDTGDYATAKIVFDVPKDYFPVTGGEEVRAETRGNRTIVEYQQVQPSRYFTVAIGRLKRAGETRDGDLRLAGFGTGVTQGDLRSILSKSQEILRHFEDLFGPCPYRSLNIVFAEGVTAGGHSPPGMTVLSKRSVRLQRALRDDPADFSDVPDFFLAHELAHQWWGHGVAPENYRERWISEAFAHYAAALWVRHAAGENEFLRVVDRMGRWARRMTDEGPIRLGYRLGHIKQQPQVFRAIVYDKGAYVLHMLSGVVGDDAFLEALRKIQQEHRFQKIGTDDFRRALENESGRDLRGYFDAWIYGTALPRLRLSSQRKREGAENVTTVKVAVRDLPGPVPLLVTLGGSRAAERHVVILEPAGGSWVFRTRELSSRVRINDDKRILAFTKD